MQNLKKGFEFIDKIEELSAMPTIALDVMSMLNDSRASVHQIVDKIQLDQAMITYILKCCNSPLYGIRTEVTSLSLAINLLGFTNVRSILMSYFMRNLYHLSGKNEIKNMLWTHSIAVAVFTKILMTKLGGNPEEGYLAGILHDIGKMILYLDHPGNYAKVIDEVARKGKRFIEAENTIFNFNHVDAGHYLLEKWNFSELLRRVVLHHHDDQLFEGRDKIISVVALADNLAFVYVSKRNLEFENLLQYFKIPRKSLEKIVEEALHMIDDYQKVI